MRFEEVPCESTMLCADKIEMKALINFYLNEASKEDKDKLYSAARHIRDVNAGPRVFLRGLIEFSSFCRNDCFYCGLCSTNRNAVRYRMSAQEILETIEEGYKLGFRSFVLQSGEDPYYFSGRLTEIVSESKRQFPNIAVTLSVGVLDPVLYLELFRAGADRFLLRHETADENHFAKLHDASQHFSLRKESLESMKQIGYQIGAGFMVGSPFQNVDTLTEDFLFLRSLAPHMVGMGPFRPHQDTIFSRFPQGSAEDTLVLTALCRLMLPKVMLPVTTALASCDIKYRTDAFRAGANVMMPCLTPQKYRDSYAIYDGKLSSLSEAAENVVQIKAQILTEGLRAEMSRGDHFDFRD